MAVKDWPARIGYRWQDEVTGTPYSLEFADARSAFAFVVSQRNNLLSADDILESLYDVDSGKSLSEPEVPATADDVTEIAAQAGTALPPSPEAEKAPEEASAVVSPTSSDTTGTASPNAATATSIEAGQTSSPVSSGLADVTPVELSPTAETSAPVTSDAPASTVTESPNPATVVGSTPAVSDPVFPSDVQDDTATPEPVTTDDEDEDDDFDNVGGNSDDEGPEDENNAPSIGTPTAETGGVTGSTE